MKIKRKKNGKLKVIGIGISVLFYHRFYKAFSLRSYVAEFCHPHRQSFADTLWKKKIVLKSSLFLN